MVTAIQLKGITKTFGQVVANDSIDMSVNRGEILALLGENGSGKTTLMNMLSGIYKPDSGKITVSGEEVSINSPEDSKRLRIGMVHQHFKLVEKFTAADNICISARSDKSLFLTNERNEKIKRFSEKYGFELDPCKRVRDMAVSEKQTVEILKVLYNGADILILDEPTAVLTLQETRKLFDILRKMKAEGCAVIIITHKLNEVLEISDRVTILRKGKSIATVNTAETNAKQLTELMVGHAVSLRIDRPESNPGEALLSLDSVTVRGEEGANAVDSVSFELHGGEILGVAGVAGCGQKELCEAIAGLRRLENGAILYRGQHIEGQSAREIIEHGISMSFIPEDRLGMGLAASLSITDNMMLKNYTDAKGPFVDRKKAAASADKIVKELDIVTPGIDTPVRRLSGGNVQKVLLGREILAKPNVIITAYPVRGLDINSSYTIYNILNDEKKNGSAVLFVGEDLDVMLELCDRIMVLCHGRVTGMVDAKTATKEQLGLLMTAAHEENHEMAAEKTAADKTAACEPAKAENNEDGAVEKAAGGSNVKIAVKTAAEALEPTAASASTATLNGIQSNNVQSVGAAAKHKKRVQLFHIVKRQEMPVWKNFVFYICSVLAALALGGLFVLSNGVNPFSYYQTVLIGCFKNTIYIRGFIRIIIPLIITSLGVAVAFKMKFWNIGANGQFIAGAIGAATAALLIGNALPKWLTLVIMAVAGIIFGGIFGLIPALCKIKFGTSETLLTLMLNYIAYYILTYLKNLMFYRKVSDTGTVFRPDFKILPENSWLYEVKIGGVSIDISLFIALILVAAAFVYFRHTKQGYEISVVGDSANTARYAGMNVKKIIVRTMFISSAVVGLCGMLQVSGSATSHTLADGITSDVGWTGIIVAWLAKLNPFGILVVSVLMGILQKGSAVAETVYPISSAASDILEAIILFSVLAADFFIRYKIMHSSKSGEEKKPSASK